MKSNFFVLHNVSDFAPGAFENVAVEEGCLQLGYTGGAYLESGCYTSPAFWIDNFCELIPSWNVDTPPGTEAEVEVRIRTSEKWSKWFGFGRWSPFIMRRSPEVSEDGPVKGDVGRLVIEGDEAGKAAQVRIWLYSTDRVNSPMVHLLSLSVRPKGELECAPFTSPTEVYNIPAYSCLVRDPSIASRIAVPTALAMMMNRFGEDVLPEEVARNMYDSGSGRFGNVSFISAAAGMYGYECVARYLDAGSLRKEMNYSQVIAAMVNYRAPMLGEDAAEQQEKGQTGNETLEARAEQPVLNCASHNSSGHLVVLRGFTIEDGREMVYINDPLAPSDEAVLRKISFAEFCEIYYGFFYTLRKMPRWHGTKGKAPGFAKPERRLTQLILENGEIKMSAHGEALAFGEDLPVNVSKVSIGYTLSDGVAYASAAQKKFYYLAPNENNELCFDMERAAGHKLSVYLVGSRGTTWVAEKYVETPKNAAGGNNGGDS